eukprot:CAMPEP_0202859898 /NCGR_PEP_ID=MMETSP1391-20130828/1827_1 /ASSEMBLY_ACC=CAM_ASM_000867 /TAXON_ID=1034604 /ORGANISM="Chlamydomonas leiostraca, Strain SAG 11-49" /LENGTH=1006 /DNA_ID=CAMNT_0049538999 /DNA_START=339 /DNA_END=3359 /DNA_ORIENTATION=-
MPIIDPSKKNEDGTPSVKWVYVKASEMEQAEQALQAREAARRPELARTPIVQQDLHRLDVASPSRPTEQVEVPGVKRITDPGELNLIGQGLPVIQGGQWPGVYWEALTAMSKGEAAPVPRPHPKFDVTDMQRIAAQGPRFQDVVARHAERTGEGEAVEYAYVPRTVLGDWFGEVEPQWAQLEQVSVPQFFVGLRARNWTAGKHFQPNAPPWRVQLFSCAYEGGTAWKGLRALVTVNEEPLPAAAPLPRSSKAQQGQGQGVSGGRRFWVDMPEPGPAQPLHSRALADPATAGYNAVLTQLYQAYEQRLPKAARQELATQGYLTPGAYPYACPADKQLEVSWHTAADPVTHPLQRFLISPSWREGWGWIRRGIAESGITDLKFLRERLMFQVGPEPVQLNLYFDPNNAGPLYFLVCLTLGIVIPALRRNKILDIKTLEEDPGAAMEFARSKSTARKEGLTGVVFKDVAGLGPLLSEVTEVVEFLKDPKSFSRLGARPPKGILLEGDPGTGKTLLAKALAGEAMVPFYQMTGTEFTEGIVGLGAARVRDLFKRARAVAPCVIFVDELDALGLKRAEGDGSGKVNEEREQTLNQLLTEMDGFTPDTGVVFIGATNRADLLDPALMRPGRFDRKVRMPKPDTEGRYEILNLHLRNKSVAPDVDLLQLARDLPGLVGADLANIVNEAQLAAVRTGRSTISARDMYAGVDRFTQGERRPALPESSKLPVTVFAAKEAGIALVAGVLRARHGRIEPVERVSIQPKGRSYSRTLFARGTDEEYQVMTRGRLMDRIKVALAGHIAVRVVLGQETNFSGPDINRAHRMAQKLVFYYGMSPEAGITTWAQQPYSTDFYLNSNRPRKVVSTDAMDEYADWPTRNEDFRFDPLSPSDPTWHRYTDSVRKVIKECYEEVWGILEERRAALWAGVAALAEQRELLGGELRDVFDAHPPAPAGSYPAPALDTMSVFTSKERGTDIWPYGIEWLNDAYPVPYWARKQIEAREKEKGEAQKAAAV